MFRDMKFGGKLDYEYNRKLFLSKKLRNVMRLCVTDKFNKIKVDVQIISYAKK
jgi:hypothetical protein